DELPTKKVSQELIDEVSQTVDEVKLRKELGHEHKFIAEIVARRGKDSIVSITKADYKNFNNNDIEDMYLLIVNHKYRKKEKRVMRHQKIHKFFDETLKRVLEGLKSYNNNVKCGYVTSNISKEDVEYL
nr:hypothetical protein [Tanacetum cinerariifolium]